MSDTHSPSALRKSLLQVFSVFSWDVDDEPKVDGDRSLLEQLQDRRRWIVRQRNKLKRLQVTALTAGALLLGWGLLQTTGRDPLIFFPVLYGATFLGAAYAARGRLRMVLEDLQDLDFDIDLQQFQVAPRESRAERILRIHQLQLRRYYDLNLVQSIWVFGLGAFCIILGVAVIAATLFLVSQPSVFTGETPDKTEKIIVAVLGGIGSILANFIGIVYLNMHASNAASMREFHDRLAEMQALLLGNLLASRIETDEQRETTLSDLALAVSQNGARRHSRAEPPA